ncbi:exodeoxyribonuclease I [Buchnera aphidicola]|uniref:exodeoxyribonuclease I n=1 Tax=Buchnera aphidicola TaxID=9 RepID=UPI0034648225
MFIKDSKCSFLFYDYETFGLHPALDKPAQFACIRTDSDFNVIQKPIVLYCYPPNDYLPNIQSVLTTHISPIHAYKIGMNEFFFSKKIFDIFNVCNTCIVGYNNIQFDDEVTRNIFYRNLLDSYSWCWKQNNSRWDVIKIILACYVLSPNNFEWPKNDFGNISFKLQDLTNVNNITHTNKHDALSDVYATVYLIKLIKKKKPELLNFLFKYRVKNNIKNLIDIQNRIPIIYISNIFGRLRNYTSCIIPIFWNMQNSNMLVFFDLYYNIEDLIEYMKHIANNNIDIYQLRKVGINFLYINRCPVLIPINFFSIKKLSCLGINSNIVLKKICLLYKNILLIEKINIFFTNFKYNYNNTNVDLGIYNNFFSQKDHYLMKVIHNTEINKLNKKKFFFYDNRLKELFFRLRARNFPEILNIFEKKKWLLYRFKKFNRNYINDYLMYLNKISLKYRYNNEKTFLLQEIKKYVNFLF